MRRSWIAVVFLAVCPLLVSQQTLNNESVVKLAKAGLSDELIVSTINASPGNYDTSAEGLIALKQAGVSDKVVTAIVQKASATIPAQSHDSPATTPPPAATNDKEAPVPAPASPSPEEPASPDTDTTLGSSRIPAGARVVIAPMGGFETYFAAVVREKKVPVTLTLNKNNAQYFIVSTKTEWEGFVYGSGGHANWNAMGGNASYGSAGSSTRGLEASIMVVDAKSKDVVWAYEVHKSSHGALIFGTLGARGQQSLAETCAKHLKAYIEKGK